MTLGPKHPNDDTKHEPFISRKQIWNWQNNANNYQAKLVLWRNARKV